MVAVKKSSSSLLSLGARQKKKKWNGMVNRLYFFFFFLFLLLEVCLVTGLQKEKWVLLVKEPFYWVTVVWFRFLLLVHWAIYASSVLFDHLLFSTHLLSVSCSKPTVIFLMGCHVGWIVWLSFKKLFGLFIATKLDMKEINVLLKWMYKYVLRPSFLFDRQTICPY